MKNNSSQSGFSLVEVLVAITILLLVVTGPMTIISRANNSTAFATEQVNAFFLAQEGLELVQKGRDDFLLRYLQRLINGTGGITNPMTQFQATYPACFTASGCGLIINSDSSPSVGYRACTGTSCLLYQSTVDNVRPIYTHDDAGNTRTPFTRVITIEEIRNGAGTRTQEFKVTSTVTWRTGSLLAGQRVELVTYLANIYDTD